jgi:hypothetical protein
MIHFHNMLMHCAITGRTMAKMRNAIHIVKASGVGDKTQASHIVARTAQRSLQIVASAQSH